MNSDQLMKWLTILSNVGVLIGLVFLVVEINQNSRIAAATAQLDLAQDRRETYEYANSMMELDFRFRFGQEVTPVERVIGARLYEARIRTYETQWHFWRNGLIDDEQFQAYFEQLADQDGTMAEPRILELWEDTKSIYHPDFVRMVDARLESLAAEAVQ